MDLVQDEDRWWGLMNMGMNFRVPLNAGSFFFFLLLLLRYVQLLLLVKVRGISISQFVRGSTNLQERDIVLLVSDHVVPFTEQTIRSPILCGYKPIHIRNPELLQKDVAKGRALLSYRIRPRFGRGFGHAVQLQSCSPFTVPSFNSA